jgi:hypothetical protein
VPKQEVIEAILRLGCVPWTPSCQAAKTKADDEAVKVNYRLAFSRVIRPDPSNIRTASWALRLGRDLAETWPRLGRDVAETQPVGPQLCSKGGCPRTAHRSNGRCGRHIPGLQMGKGQAAVMHAVAMLGNQATTASTTSSCQ